MKIGILYEGDYDQEPFSILLKRIILSGNNKIQPEFIFSAAYGNISSKVDSALKLFFEVDSPCDSAIFINDLDNKEDRCRSIKAKVRAYKQKHPENNVLVLCPNPTFEVWFLDEENALKNVLNLPMEQELPFAEMRPKARIEKLIFKYNNDYIRSKMDIYKEIAEKINIQSLILRNSEFKKLYVDYLN